MKRLAPAKINLYLGVSSQVDERGYHLVNTVMAPLELADEVEVELASSGGIQLTCAVEAGVLAGSEQAAPSGEASNFSLPPEPHDNLAWKAAARLAEALGQPAHMRIALRKHVPSQAGLGGGSSDAAAVLLCLAQAWGADPTGPEVVQVARSLGADVPFFLYESTCLLRGLGDAWESSFALPALNLALVKPPVGVSTPAAYRQFDVLGTPAGDLDALLRALAALDVAAICANLSNNLQSAACALQPPVAQVLAFLAQQESDALAAPLLCGSGACCALICADADAARAVAARAAREHGWWSCATRTA